MTTVTSKLKKYLFGSKISSISSIMSVIKHDISNVLAEYMKLIADPIVIADIDENSGNIVLSITANATDIYDSGEIIK